MRAAPQDNDRLNREVERLVEQLKALGAVQIILFGSLARGRVSLFSDIDLLVLFEKPGSARELGRWVYQAIQTGEGVDILAYNRETFHRICHRPFFRRLLAEGKVLYERPAT